MMSNVPLLRFQIKVADIPWISVHPGRSRFYGIEAKLTEYQVLLRDMLHECAPTFVGVVLR